METLKALDALFALFIKDNSVALLGVLTLGLGALSTWLAARNAKRKAAADGVVETINALASPRVPMSNPEKKVEAAFRLEEITGVPARKLHDDIEAAIVRRKKRIDSKRPPPVPKR